MTYRPTALFCAATITLLSGTVATAVEVDVGADVAVLVSNASFNSIVVAVPRMDQTDFHAAIRNRFRNTLEAHGHSEYRM